MDFPSCITQTVVLLLAFSIQDVGCGSFNSYVTGSNFARVCFFSGSSIYRDGLGHALKPAQVDPFLCTHIVYASAILAGNGTTLGLPEGFEDLQQFRDLTQLKNINPDLRIMLSVGGWDEDTKHWSNLVSSRANMVAFAEEVANYLKHHNFDGLNLDWEYPATRGSPATDKNGYAELAEVLNTEFKAGVPVAEEPEDIVPGNQGLLLSVCVMPTKVMLQKSYDIMRLSRTVDFINLHLYDLYGHWDEPTKAYPHSALTDENGLGLSNVNSLMRDLVNLGLPKQQLVLGIPFFGRSYRLQDQNFTGPGSLAVGPGSDGGDGLPIRNLCHLIKHGGFTEQMFAGVPYIVSGYDWISYDNPASVQEKAGLVRNNQLGGVYVWSIDMDDYLGGCGVKYPLMMAVLQGLQAYDRYKILRQQYDLLTTKPPLTTQPTINLAAENEPQQQQRAWQAPVTKTWHAPVTNSWHRPVENKSWNIPGHQGWVGQQTTTPITTKAPFFW